MLSNILLLSIEGPNLKTAGGILLFRLLEHYPMNRLFVIEQDADPSRGQLDCEYRSLRTRWQRLEQSRLHRFKRSLRGLNLVPSVKESTVKELLGSFRPDVILCVMQYAAYYETAWSYARRHRIPLVVIVHDVNDQFEPVLPLARLLNRRRDAKFYRFARRRLCVSPEMERLCWEQYGVRGDVMYPNRSERLEARPIEASARLKRPEQLTIGFAGNLNYGYGEELLRLLPAFRKTQSRVVMFSRPLGTASSALLEARDCVDFRGFAHCGPEYVWKVIQSECDAVLLPYPNPAGHRERLYRHHFPSKLPEYLALGMPVIVTGPEYATGVKWALNHPNAVVAYTGTDLKGITDLLENLRNFPDRRVELAKKAVEAGNEAFDPHRIRDQFIAALTGAAWNDVEGSRRSLA